MRNNQTAIASDRETLAGVGLKMPRCTPKYVEAVTHLAQETFMATAHLHARVARGFVSRAGLYRDMKRRGWAWDSERQCWRKEVNDERK